MTNKITELKRIQKCSLFNKMWLIKKSFIQYMTRHYDLDLNIALDFQIAKSNKNAFLKS